jgi:DNA-binding Xre family transcriptional regulator
MISFKPFRQWFVTDPKRMKRELTENAGINPRTLSKVWNDGNVTLDTVDKICSYYSLPIQQVIEFVPQTEKE